MLPVQVRRFELVAIAFSICVIPFQIGFAGAVCVLEDFDDIECMPGEMAIDCCHRRQVSRARKGLLLVADSSARTRCCSPARR